MEPEKDEWFWAAGVVTTVAMFCWAFSAVTHIGGAWVGWAAVIISVLALGGMATRAGLRARDVVWTEEMKEAQRRRIVQRMQRDLIPTLLLGLVVLIPNGLMRAGILPEWEARVLFLVLFMGNFCFWVILRRRRARKDIS